MGHWDKVGQALVTLSGFHWQGPHSGTSDHTHAIRSSCSLYMMRVCSLATATVLRPSVLRPSSPVLRPSSPVLGPSSSSPVLRPSTTRPPVSFSNKSMVVAYPSGKRPNLSNNDRLLTKKCWTLAYLNYNNLIDLILRYHDVSRLNRTDGRARHGRRAVKCRGGGLSSGVDMTRKKGGPAPVPDCFPSARCTV
jgi:hypothetical protein